MDQHMRRRVGQDKLLTGESHWGCGQPAAIGGDQEAVVVGCEEHAVEDVAGLVRGRSKVVRLFAPVNGRPTPSAGENSPAIQGIAMA
jgi:hypothetical protein